MSSFQRQRASQLSSFIAFLSFVLFSYSVVNCLDYFFSLKSQCRGVNECTRPGACTQVVFSFSRNSASPVHFHFRFSSHAASGRTALIAVGDRTVAALTPRSVSNKPSRCTMYDVCTNNDFNQSLDSKQAPTPPQTPPASKTLYPIARLVQQ